MNSNKTNKFLSIVFTLVLLLGIALPTADVAAATTTDVWKTAVNYDSLTLTISKPDGVTQGKILLAQITFEKGLDALPITAPTGWKHVVTTHADQSGGYKDLGQSIFWKLAESMEPNSYTFTFGQKVKALGGIIGYSGVDANDPIVAFSGQGGEGDTTGQNQLVAPSLNAIAGTKLVAFYGFKELAILDTPAGMTSIYQERDTQNDYTILAADEDASQSGATGERISRSWEFDDPAKSVESEWTAQLVLLRTSGSQSTNPAPVPVAKVVVLIDGKPFVMSDQPYIENGRVLVPMRALFEALGAEVSWDNTNRVAMGVHSGYTIRIPIDSTTPTINGIPVIIDVPARITNSRTYIPLRFVGEGLGYSVNWDSITRTVTISTT